MIITVKDVLESIAKREITPCLIYDKCSECPFLKFGRERKDSKAEYICTWNTVQYIYDKDKNELI